MVTSSVKLENEQFTWILLYTWTIKFKSKPFILKTAWKQKKYLLM